MADESKPLNKEDEGFLVYLGKYIMVPVLVAVVTSVSTAYITAKLSRDNDREQRRWELKREAGLRALKVVDQYFANQSALRRVSNQQQVSYQFEAMDKKEAREVCNELVVACDNTNAVAIYLEILSLGKSEGRESITMDRIQDLRNAIRKELGFGQPLELNRDGVWIADLFPNIQTNSPAIKEPISP